MPVKSFRPLTPSTRYITIASYAEVTKTRPEKHLVTTRKKTGGRNCYGRVTAIEYDPIRTARLALLEYKDGEKRYIIAPNGVRVGARLLSGPDAPPEPGNSLPLKSVPIGLSVHNIEL